MNAVFGILRASLRLLILPVITVSMVMTLSLGLLLRVPFPGLGWPLFRWAINTWGRGVLLTMGVRVTISGQAPKPPFFLVANHLSYLDIPLLHSQMHGHFLSKAEIASWPIAGLFAKLAGTLFVDRSLRGDLKRVIPEVETLLRTGNGVMIFPEGTSSMGAEILPFKASLFEVARRAQVAVSTAALKYSMRGSDLAVGAVVCWWGNMPFASHFLRLLTVPGVDAQVTFGSQVPIDDDRKRLSSRAQEAVFEHFHPSTPAEHVAELRRVFSP